MELYLEVKLEVGLRLRENKNATPAPRLRPGHQCPRELNNEEKAPPQAPLSNRLTPLNKHRCWIPGSPGNCLRACVYHAQQRLSTVIKSCIVAGLSKGEFVHSFGKDTFCAAGSVSSGGFGLSHFPGSPKNGPRNNLAALGALVYNRRIKDGQNENPG
jgi:hypothetical protein